MLNGYWLLAIGSWLLVIKRIFIDIHYFSAKCKTQNSKLQRKAQN